MVAHTLDDKRQKGGKGGDGEDSGDVANDCHELLPIGNNIDNVPASDGSIVYIGLFLGTREVELHTTDGVDTLLGGEEPGSGEVLGQHEEGDDSQQDGDAALEEEDDLPAVDAGRLDAQQTISQEPCTGTRYTVHARKEADSEPYHVLWIHSGHVVHADLGETGLGGTNEQTKSNEAAGAADGGVAHAENTPSDELHGDEVLDADAASEDDHEGLQGDVSGREEREGVGNVVWLEVGVVRERARGHETDVGLVDTTEL